MRLQSPVITVDGPGAVGKETLADQLARFYGYWRLDSGRLYRAITVMLLEEGTINEGTEEVDEARAIQVASELDFSKFEHRISDLYSAVVNKWVPKVAKILGVRKAIKGIQRRSARAPGTVVDGRDMGTEIFPDADVKIYLDADARERARREYNRLIEKGYTPDLEEVLKSVEARDKMDREREHSPLRPANDAFIIDTTGLSKEEVYQRALEICKRELDLQPA